MAKEEGVSIKDFCALHPDNDPFYTGRPADKEWAQWFKDIWDQAGYTTGVHLRRVHYRLVRGVPVKKPDGQIYQNTKTDWKYLAKAGKHARYLGLVDPEALIDRRNPDPVINAYWNRPGEEDYQDPTPRYGVDFFFWREDYDLPDVPELPALPNGLPNYPDFTVNGYSSIEQGYHVEIWVEKSTMHDILLPICRQYNVNLVAGQGELSITRAVEFLQRVRRADRPARILYISDYDPAGTNMPVAIARKIEFFQREEGWDDLDIRLQPVALTAEQVAQYDLPRIPVKESDLKKANWEAIHGTGQVELDALEALHEGELDRIVRAAVTQYYDDTLRQRAMEARDNLREVLDAEQEEVVARYQSKLDALEAEYNDLVEAFEQTREEFDELVRPFRPKIEAYNQGLQDLLNRADDVYSTVQTDLEAVEIDLEEDFRLPDPDLPPEPDNQLYDSHRSYLFQLLFYNSHRRNNGEP